MKKILLVLIVSFFVTGMLYAWKPDTHMYIVNTVLDDARDGKVTLPLPNGKSKSYNVNPQILSVVKNAANDPFFRAGSIGPDGFPDLFTGQSVIHAQDTDAWLLHLKDMAQMRFASREDVSAFFLGYCMHLIGDMWAHDWVNYYAGGSYPGVKEFYADTAASFQNAMKHTAIEATLDDKLSKVNPSMADTIAIPRDYMFDVITYTPLVLYTRKNLKTGKEMDIQVEMFSTIQVLIDKYWEMWEKKNASSIGLSAYEKAWYKDLENGLKAWIAANDNAMKRMIKGEGMFTALKDEYKNWASEHLLSMVGFPDVIAKPIQLSAILTESAAAMLNAMGFTSLKMTINELTDSFTDWAIRKITNRGIDDWKTLFEARVTAELFGDAVYAKIISEIASIPAQSAFKHGSKNENMNALVYNSILVSKLALLSGDTLNLYLADIGSKLRVDKNNFIPEGIYSIDKSGQFNTGVFGKFYQDPLFRGLLMNNYSSGGYTDLKLGTAHASEKIKSLIVTVKTKDSFGSGTDADIYFGMSFADGKTKEWLLDKENYNDFERGDKDNYPLDISGVLLMKKVTNVWIRMGTLHGTGNDWDFSWFSVKINGNEVFKKTVNKTFDKKGSIAKYAINGF